MTSAGIVVRTGRSSSTTLDPTVGPQDELVINFSAAACPSNTSNTFVSTTQGPDLFTLPLEPGVIVSGEIVHDASTITAPFLPGDRILACIPPRPVLFSAHHGAVRLRIGTGNALEIPDNMTPDHATAYLSALQVGAAILKRELHIPVTRTPTASPHPAEDAGVGTYNDKRILVVGGHTHLGAALVQLLHRALPQAKILVTCESASPSSSSPSSSSSSSSPPTADLARRARHLEALGARTVVDGTPPDLADQLPPSVDIIIHAARGPEPVRPDLMDLLDGLHRFVECAAVDVEATVSSYLEDESDCVTSLHELLFSAAAASAAAEGEGEGVDGDDACMSDGSEGGLPLAKQDDFQREDSGFEMD
jgi:hypothetical protein